MFENTQELAENKLLLLYIFDKVEGPVSNTWVTEFVLENNLLNYFHLQQYLSELVNSSFLIFSKEEKKQYYTLSPKGKKVLEYFENRIAKGKRDIITSYLIKDKKPIKKQTEIFADYAAAGNDKYIVSCKIIENGVNLIDIKLNIESLELARQICSKWKSGALKTYGSLLSMLTD